MKFVFAYATILRNHDGQSEK